MSSTDEKSHPIKEREGNLSTTTDQTIKTGHPTGFWFFFWGEFAERCSFYGMRAILPLYLSDQLGYGDARGGQFYFLFIAACYLLPLLGGFIADNFLGKYLTIVMFSVPYVAGQFLIGFSEENRWLLIVSLLLLSMGTGVIKPNISTLMGLTYDQQRPGQEALRSAAFSYFYMAINIGAFLSQVSLPAIRDAYDYQTAFMVPGVLMIVALIIFALGKPFYAKEIVGKQKDASPEERALKWKTLRELGGLFLVVVFFWAVFDQSSATWVYFARTYMDREVGLIDLGFLQLREIPPDGIQTLNPFFIVLFTPVMVMLWSRLEKKGIKVRATRKMFIGFVLTTGTMGIMAVAAFLAGNKQTVLQIAFPEGTIVVPKADLKINGEKKEITEDDEKLTEFQSGDYRFSDQVSAAISQGKLNTKGKLSFSNGELTLPNGKLVFENGKINFEKSKAIFPEGLINLPGVLTSRFKNGTYLFGDSQLVIQTWEAKYTAKSTPKEPDAKEKKEKAPKPTYVTVSEVDYVPPAERCSVWWMAFAFLILTVAELLISVTGLELAFTAAPASMKGFVTGCWLLTVFIANLAINAPLADLYPVMKPSIYFLLLTAMGAAVTFIFTIVARRFNLAMKEKAEREVQMTRTIEE